MIGICQELWEQYDYVQSQQDPPSSGEKGLRAANVTKTYTGRIFGMPAELAEPIREAGTRSFKSVGDADPSKL